MSFLTQLESRYATKQFDPANPITSEQYKAVLNAIRMAPTSLGLQPFHVTVVKSAEVKAQLAANGWNQPQFTTADYVLVFSGRTDVLDRSNTFTTEMLAKGAPKEKMDAFHNMVVGLDSGFATNDARIAWAKYQAYIALGFGLAAAAELGIDSCPMEGFDRDAFKKILGLPENFYPAAVLAIGNHAKEDVAYPKFRFSNEDLFGTAL
jgi:nitroreductase